ncbi:3-hexulose-6-phosphate synthase [Virgibacillus necropolis]|uniref:3-hexulose-6-phosphate synthase n=1 Tax=Virgibacillus necropolis TaxID=163877 RepID=A0A221M9Y0_9BACI|nr:3-hexulose-6-phosphate synthase [Virgibacillus necropolis]ASN04445.1 Fe-S cluster assembly protein HesB [Virgibacillus necropolis]
MKLQLALDRLTRDECIRIVKETEKEMDIIEVGTGVIKEYGMAIVREMKELFPDKQIVADMKTCDAGKHEALQAFEAGADITTVMAFSANSTITDMLNVASDKGSRLMVDLLEVRSRERVKELHDLGVDLVSLHVGKDKQAEESFNTDLFSLLKGFEFEVTVAGGINLDKISAVVQEKPDTIIVGSAITKAEDPKKVAARMRAYL